MQNGCLAFNGHAIPRRRFLGVDGHHDGFGIRLITFTRNATSLVRSHVSRPDVVGLIWCIVLVAAVRVHSTFQIMRKQSLRMVDSVTFAPVTMIHNLENGLLVAATIRVGYSNNGPSKCLWTFEKSTVSPVFSEVAVGDGFGPSKA